MKKVVVILSALTLLVSCTAEPRDWMAHRGVHLGYTAAGENSLEAVDLAARAGFVYIETDCRWTSDSVMVIIHDAALNRTFNYADGTPLGKEKVNVADLTFEELRRDFRLKASSPERRSVIPTLEEYLLRCKEQGFRKVLIEPKLKDSTGVFYRQIIDIADKAIGRDNYLVVSNNYANGVIRNTLGIKDVELMGLLYQTSWDEMDALGGTVFALSSTKFSPEEFKAYYERAKADGKTIESASGLRSQESQVNFETYNMLKGYGRGIDMIATDLHTPDYKGQGKTVCKFRTSKVEEIGSRLSKLEKAELYGIYLEMEYDGIAAVKVGPDAFLLPGGKELEASYSRTIYDSKPSVEIIPGEGFKLRNCKIRIIGL